MILKKTTSFFFFSKRLYCNYSKSFSSSGGNNSSEFTIKNEVPQNISNLSLEIPIIDPNINGKHFDVAVIGGGSAGLAFANVFKIKNLRLNLFKEANKLGLKVILFDYVDPSYQGTKWGIGGTCVNVGCIPKKLMHTAALNAEKTMNSYNFGYNINEINSHNNPDNLITKSNLYFNWKVLVQNVQSYIKSMNFGYKSKLKQQSIPYVNALASFSDSNTLVFTPKKEILLDFIEKQRISEEHKDKLGKITSDFFVICTGGRPNYLPEAECIDCIKHSITSDDIFSLKKPPNKTLVVGGGYIALECAGFLTGLGYPVSIMTRGLYLRSFDQDISQMILDDMVKFNGLHIIEKSLPIKIEGTSNGRKKVTWKSQAKKSDPEITDEFDTVLFAIGRTPNTGLLNLEKANVKLNKKSQKILGGFNNETELTSNSKIYALGDILEGVPELTPVAQKSAYFLARRINAKKNGTFEKEKEKYDLSYDHIPTTIFTPSEYSCVGLSEESAAKQYGADNIEVYHSKYNPLEEYLSDRTDEKGDLMQRKAYCKIITLSKENDKIVGVHYLGPNAGEIMQGLAVAFRMGLKKSDLDLTFGIHPTTAEEFTNLRITKRSGESPEKKSC